MTPAVPDSALLNLLDAGFAARTLGALRCISKREIRSPHLSSMWVKPGRYFNASYRLSGARSQAGLGEMASLFALGAQADKARRRMGPHNHSDRRDSRSCARCASVVASEGLLIQLFPFDYRLPTLARCHDPSAVSAVFGSPVREVLPTTYRAGMRCQIEYQLEDGQRVFGKVAFERVPGRNFRQQRLIYAAARQGTGELGVARPRCFDGHLGLSVVDAAAGKPLDEGYLDGTAKGVLPRVARALAELHSLDAVPGDRTHGVCEEVTLLASWVELISVLFPGLGRQLKSALDGLKTSAPESGGGVSLVHRDFFDKQVLVSDDSVVFLDLDTACAGEAEIDLANFCAHLRLRSWQAEDILDDGTLVESFLGAYPNEFSREKFEWYRRATFLRLACVYSLRAPWQSLIPALIAESVGQHPVSVLAKAQ